MKEIAAAFGQISQQEINAIQAAEAQGNAYTLNHEGGEVVLNPGDYMISSEDMPGWLVATDGPLTLALDIEVSPELKNEGVARELVNRIQNIRKESDFDVTDKVEATVFADGEAYAEIEEALKSYKDYVCSQTLANTLVLKPLADADSSLAEVEWNETAIKIAVTRN